MFDGNEVFSDGKLAGRMKKIKAAGFWNLSWLGGKSKYTESRWLGEAPDVGDQKRLEDFYLNHGYVTARVGAPRVSYTDGKTGSLPEEAGEVDHLDRPRDRGGAIPRGGGEVRGADRAQGGASSDRSSRRRRGTSTTSRSSRRASTSSATPTARIGYFQWTGGPKRTPDPARKVVDVTLAMDEDKRYYVGQITITGNDSTRDKVVRREIYLNEGDVFNTEALKATIRRINQLGYFKPLEGAPDLQPSPRGEDKLDVTLKVEEQNRNQFTFGGGVSGLEGAFVNGSFSTTNFLGAGETVSLAAQAGGRTKNYQLAVTEPYFLDRPAHAGPRGLPAPPHLPLQRERDRVLGAEPGPRRHHRVPAEPLLPRLRELLVPDRRPLRRGRAGAGEAPERLGAGQRLDRRSRRRPRAAPGKPGSPVREPHHALLGAQHGGQPLPAPERHASHRELPVHGRPARRVDQLLPAVARDRLLPPVRPEDGPRRAGRGRVHAAVRRNARGPVLPALLPRRGDADPRVQGANRLPASIP